MGIDWKAIKKEYEISDAPLTALAREFGCHAATIGRKIKKESWKKAGRPDGEHDARDAAADELADGHKSLWKGVRKRLVNGLENSDLKQGLEELKVAKMAGEVLTSVIKGERLAWGIDTVGDGIEITDAQHLASEMEEATAPSGADKALE